MTVEIEYNVPGVSQMGEWQVNMANQIEANRGLPMEKIDRELVGETLLVRVETTLSKSEVKNMLSDIEDHLPNGSSHVETRHV